MGPLSTFYSQEVMTWLRNNPGRIVTQFQLGKLFGIAYAKAATLQNALSGFSKTGIYPLNPNIFSDHDFVSASTTDNDITDSQTIANFSENVIHDTRVDKNNPVPEPKPSTAEVLPIYSQPITFGQSAVSPQPCTSWQSAMSPQPKTSRQSASISLAFSPADILPNPHVLRKTISNGGVSER